MHMVSSQNVQDFNRDPVLFLSLTLLLGEYGTIFIYKASLGKFFLNNPVPHFLSGSTTVTQSRESH